MMTFTQAVTRVCNRLNKNSSDTIVTARIKNHINDICQEKWLSYAWSFRWREYPLVLSAQVTDITSGMTLTATNGSQTVTASGAVFVTGTHEGAWVRFMADSYTAWYRILSVTSTTQVIVEPAYQGTTGSSKTFQLCKTEYDLPAELSDLGRLKISYNGRPLQIQHQVINENYFTPPLSVGPPYLVSLFTRDFTTTTYSTGTVTGTANTKTLTGVGTSWLANVLPGDELTITNDAYTYKVQSVTSNTALTLYNNILSSPSGTAYVATRQYQIQIRISPCPDVPYVCYAKGLKSYSPMVNDADTNELLLRFPFAVIEGAVWREASSSPDQREDALYMKSEKMWDEAKSMDTEILPQSNSSPIFDARFGYK